MSSTSQLFSRLLAAGLVVQLAAVAEPLYAPPLLFNWTLRNVDAPLRLSGFPLTSPTDPNSPAAKTGSQSGDAGVAFVGSGISFNGQSSGWETTGSDGLPKEAGFAYVTGDATWDSSNNKLFKPVSDSVLWARSTPRFMEYTMSIQAFVGNWTLTNVDVMTGMNSSAASLAEVPARVEKFVTDDGKINPFYNTTGNWNVVPASGSLPTQAKCYDDAILRVAIPKGTAYIVVNGTRSTASRNMYFVFEENGDGVDRITDVINAEFPSSTEALLYMRPLNPSNSYVLVMTCVFTGTYGEQGLTSMTFYEGAAGSGGSGSNNGGSGGGSSTSSSNSSGSNGGGGGNGGNGGNGSSSGSGSKISTGAIVGIVVAVVAVALIVLLGWCCLRRRRNKAAKSASGAQAYQSGRLDGDIDPNMMPTPYQYQGPQPMNNLIQPVSQVPYDHNSAPPTYGQQLKY